MPAPPRARMQQLWNRNDGPPRLSFRTGAAAYGLRAQKLRSFYWLQKFYRAAGAGRTAGAVSCACDVATNREAILPGRKLYLPSGAAGRTDRHVRGIYGDGAGGDPEGTAGFRPRSGLPQGERALRAEVWAGGPAVAWFRQYICHGDARQ